MKKNLISDATIQWIEFTHKLTPMLLVNEIESETNKQEPKHKNEHSNVYAYMNEHSQSVNYVEWTLSA